MTPSFGSGFDEGIRTWLGLQVDRADHGRGHRARVPCRIFGLRVFGRCGASGGRDRCRSGRRSGNGDRHRNGCCLSRDANIQAVILTVIPVHLEFAQIVCLQQVR